VITFYRAFQGEDMEYAIGCDIGGSFVKIGSLSREGDILSSQTIPLPEVGSAEELAEWISKILLKIYEKEKENKLMGAGIGIPGPLRYPEGILYDPPNLPFKGKVPIKKMVQEYLPFPVFFDNDATVQTLGEAWKGLGAGLKNFLCLALGTGIGGGIVIDSKIYRGTDGMAGEIGHMTVFYNGRKCLCGSRGCLETYASINGIVNSLREFDPPLPEEIEYALKTLQWDRLPKILKERIASGETQWQQVWDIFADALGAGIGSLINLFNPQRVIISGGLSYYNRLYIKRTVIQSKKHCFNQPARSCKIVVSNLKERAGIIGAAFLVFHNHE